MIQLEFINSKNVSMNAIYNPFMTLSAVDQLHGVDNEYSTSTSPYFDGDYVNHTRTSPRTITLTYSLKTPIEDSLNYFNSIVKSKQKATLIETKDDGTQIKIEGIVTVPPYTRWSDTCAIQIQLYCSKPYWRDVQAIVEDISNVINKHWFPYESVEALQNLDGGLAFPHPQEDKMPYIEKKTGAVYTGIPFGVYDLDATKGFTNNGTKSVGMIIEIVALGTVTNPRISKVNSDENEFIGVNMKLEMGDWIRINTNKGEKSVTNADGEIYNEVVYSGNDWLQLDTGYNELSITSQEGTGNMYFTIYFNQEWQ